MFFSKPSNEDVETPPDASATDGSTCESKATKPAEQQPVIAPETTTTATTAATATVEHGGKTDDEDSGGDASGELAEIEATEIQQTTEDVSNDSPQKGDEGPDKEFAEPCPAEAPLASKPKRLSRLADVTVLT